MRPSSRNVSFFWRGFQVAMLLAVGLIVVFVLAVFIYNRNVEYEPVVHGWPDVGDEAAPVAWAPNNPERIRILALEGGGLHGLAYLEILKYFEERSGKPVAELFDFVAAASVGSIVATALLVPDERGRPQNTAKDLVASFEHLTKEIISAPWYHQILTLNGILGPKFLNHGKALAAHQTFAERQFGELLLPVMVPVYSPTKAELELFSNLDEEHSGVLLGALVSAATSVPSLFPAIRLHGRESDKPYVDAAFVLTTPIIPAFLSALEKNPHAEFVVLSLGTNSKYPITRGDSIRGGLADWVAPLLAMVFSGQEEIAMKVMATFDRMKENEIETHFLKPAVPWVWGPFDTSDRNLARIKKAGQDYVAKNQAMLDEILSRLTSDP